MKTDMKDINKRKIGKICENKVVEALCNGKYDIIKQNYRVGTGFETDIIAQKERTLHFIEVKARSNKRFGLPREAINKEKLRHMKVSCELFMMENNIYDCEISFDVAEVVFEIHENKVKITNINLMTYV